MHPGFTAAPETHRHPLPLRGERRRPAGSPPIRAAGDPAVRRSTVVDLAVSTAPFRCGFADCPADERCSLSGGARRGCLAADAPTEGLPRSTASGATVLIATPLTGTHPA